MTTDQKLLDYQKSFMDISDKVLAIPSNSGTKMNVLTRLNEAFFWLGNLLKEQDDMEKSAKALLDAIPDDGGNVA